MDFKQLDGKHSADVNDCSYNLRHKFHVAIRIDPFEGKLGTQNPIAAEVVQNCEAMDGKDPIVMCSPFKDGRKLFLLI